MATCVDRKKLIALLRETEINKINGHVALAETCFTPVVFEKMADHLIANGVKIPVLCKDCQLRGSMDCPLEAYVPWYCTGDDGYCADGIRRSDGSE